ncbi:MAG TPA: hypothetical protein VFV67_33900 [Actinophytocola sp.]|uniref:hypothetical protein n=1 Tax=Actinophytocola sp. TaxID=1872138 RepID=UPI002DBD76FD|nr:hypothetical protein [Actinophytocola sp.]HEU5475661.1 hypothetical protein [Actinophytocola sp.]
MSDLLGLLANLHQAVTRHNITIAAGKLDGTPAVIDTATNTIYLDTQLGLTEFLAALGAAVEALAPPTGAAMPAADGTLPGAAHPLRHLRAVDPPGA